MYKKLQAFFNKMSVENDRKFSVVSVAQGQHFSVSIDHFYKVLHFERLRGGIHNQIFINRILILNLMKDSRDIVQNNLELFILWLRNLDLYILFFRFLGLPRACTRLSRYRLIQILRFLQFKIGMLSLSLIGLLFLKILSQNIQETFHHNGVLLLEFHLHLVDVDKCLIILFFGHKYSRFRVAVEFVLSLDSYVPLLNLFDLKIFRCDAFFELSRFVVTLHC